MRLVETDSPTPADDAALAGDGDPLAPRPEHRRVSVSLLFTLFVLVATVVTVYTLVPERHNALIETALEVHGKAMDYELEEPSPSELRAWGIALLGREVPWPDPSADVRVVGVRSQIILNRPAAIVRFEIDGEPVTAVIQRPRDPIPQVHRRLAGELRSISWRRGLYTFSAVGPADSDRWRAVLGAP